MSWLHELQPVCALACWLCMHSVAQLHMHTCSSTAVEMRGRRDSPLCLARLWVVGRAAVQQDAGRRTGRKGAIARGSRAAEASSCIATPRMLCATVFNLNMSCSLFLPFELTVHTLCWPECVPTWPKFPSCLHQGCEDPVPSFRLRLIVTPCPAMTWQPGGRRSPPVDRTSNVYGAVHAEFVCYRHGTTRLETTVTQNRPTKPNQNCEHTQRPSTSMRSNLAADAHVCKSKSKNGGSSKAGPGRGKQKPGCENAERLQTHTGPRISEKGGRMSHTRRQRKAGRCLGERGPQRRQEHLGVSLSIRICHGVRSSPAAMQEGRFSALATSEKRCNKG